jgi:hypothetical protein
MREYCGYTENDNSSLFSKESLPRDMFNEIVKNIRSFPDLDDSLRGPRAVTALEFAIASRYTKIARILVDAGFIHRKMNPKMLDLMLRSIRPSENEH